MSPKPKIALLGTGTIGFPVARNLARAGFDVRAWNRTHEKAEPLSTDGVAVKSSVADAVAEVDVLITFLADGPAVEEVMEDAAPAARKGATWIQSTTVGISATERLAEIAAANGLVFVDAPVLGTKEPAEKAELVVFASGPEEARERCAPIFDAIGKATRWVGEAGAGQRFKIIINTWLLAVVEGAAEAISLARALGVDPNDILDALSGGPLDTPYLQLKGKAMIERSFEPSFKASLARKDASLVLEAAGRTELELPLVEAVHEAFEQAVELGRGDEDLSSVVEVVGRRAGRALDALEQSLRIPRRGRLVLVAVVAVDLDPARDERPDQLGVPGEVALRVRRLAEAQVAERRLGLEVVDPNGVLRQFDSPPTTRGGSRTRSAARSRVSRERA